jgi:sugar lactone lactonase YvrE
MFSMQSLTRRAASCALFCALSLALLLEAFASFAQAAPPTKRMETGSRQPSGAESSDAGRSSTNQDFGKATDPNALHNPFPHRRHAPSLAGGVAWINTPGPIDLESLRGKFVLLDFWTYCCVNCMHVLPELKKLEAAYPNELVVIGVHSAKFETERDSPSISEAVARYNITHPVVNDARHEIWSRFHINTWPTIVLIDPEGYLVAGRSGEFKFDLVDGVLKSAVPYYRRKGVLDETPLRWDALATDSADTPLRFPGKIVADPRTNRLFISDSNHNRIVVARTDGTLIDTIGSGRAGYQDGEYATASFDHPQGMAILNDTLYVADTDNQLLRKVDLQAKRVTTIAGIPGETFNPKLPNQLVAKPLELGLNTPWDVTVQGSNLYIAMAGCHQIWKMRLDESEISAYAGNAREDIVDGPLLPREAFQTGFASFAQPSGLCTDGRWLFVADSEGSSIRAVPLDPTQDVKTVLGTAYLKAGRLFAYGDIDGSGRRPRLQHPLGIAYANLSLYVADTYNNKIKAIDLNKVAIRTIAGTGKPGNDDKAGTFDEPGGLTVAGDKLLVADTNNHRIRSIDLRGDYRVSTLEIKGLQPPTIEATQAPTQADDARKIVVEPVAVQPQDSTIGFKVDLQLPAGYKLNPMAPVRYSFEPLGKEGPIDRSTAGKSIRLEKPAPSFEIRLPLASKTGEDQVNLSLRFFFCREGSEGLCKAGSVVWQVPVRLAADATQTAVPLTVAVE